MLRKFLVLSLALFAFLANVSAFRAQETRQENQEKQEKSNKKLELPNGKNQNVTAEQVAEVTIAIYGGRPVLSQIRKTEIENGRLTRFLSDGKSEDSTYQRRIIRGESLEKDRIRVDQRLPQAEYALIYDTTKTFGVINNNTSFTPREEIDRGFQAQIFHGLDTLLRYKENGSTLNLVGKDKQMNVEYYILEVTDKQKRTTRFKISTKLYRVNSLEYEMPLKEGAAPTKFARKFYDYRYAQGTLIPYRTVLFADNKQIEEANVLTVTFGMRIDNEQFQFAE